MAPKIVCACCGEPAWVLLKPTRARESWIEACCDSCLEPVCEACATVADDGTIECSNCYQTRAIKETASERANSDR